MTRLEKRDSSLKRLCENPNFKIALKVAVVAAIVITSAALAFTPVGLFAAVTIGVVGLALYGLFESRAYGTKLFVKFHKIQIEQALLAQKIEGASAQLIENPTLIKVAELLSKTSSIEEIQIILEAAKMIKGLPIDTIAEFQSMLTRSTSPLNPKQVKDFLVRYIEVKIKINHLATLQRVDPALPRMYDPLLRSKYLPAEFHELMKQFSREYETIEVAEYELFEKERDELKKQLDDVLLAEEIVSDSRKKETLQAEIATIRTQTCCLDVIQREKLHKIQILLKKSTEGEALEPLTVQDLETLKADIENFRSIIEKSEISSNMNQLMKLGLEIIKAVLLEDKKKLDKLDSILELVNHPDSRLILKNGYSSLLEEKDQHLKRKTSALESQKEKRRLDFVKYLSEKTLSVIAFQATFQLSAEDSQAFEDKIYREIHSLLDTPNYAPYREELLGAYPPRGV
jgi:hypothetical protein